jgi:hypothetical protein
MEMSDFVDLCLALTCNGGGSLLRMVYALGLRYVGR